MLFSDRDENRQFQKKFRKKFPNIRANQRCIMQLKLCRHDCGKLLLARAAFESADSLIFYGLIYADGSMFIS